MAAGKYENLSWDDFLRSKMEAKKTTMEDMNEWMEECTKLQKRYKHAQSIKENRPTSITYWPDSHQIKEEKYEDLDGNLHNTRGPAYIKYYQHSGKPEIVKYYENGKLHRVGKPAVIEYYDDITNKIRLEKYYEKGYLYCSEGGKVIRKYDDEGRIEEEVIHNDEGHVVTISYNYNDPDMSTYFLTDYKYGGKMEYYFVKKILRKKLKYKFERVY